MEVAAAAAETGVAVKSARSVACLRVDLRWDGVALNMGLREVISVMMYARGGRWERSGIACETVAQRLNLNWCSL